MNETKTIFERNELYRQVWSKPMIKLAKEYNLSDNGLRKICKKLNIPVPKAGYWAKLQYGKDVVQTPLPPADGSPELHTSVRTSPNPKLQIEVDPEVQRIIDFESDPKNKIRVPVTVSSYRPLVLTTRDYLKGISPNHTHVLQPNTECLDIYVSRKCLNRGLRIFNSLISALAKRGINLALKNKEKKWGTCIVVKGEEFLVRISEKILQRKLTPIEIEELKKKNRNFYETREYKASGKLSLCIFYGNYGTSRKEYADGEKFLVEDKLNDLMVFLFKASKRLKTERLEVEEQHRKWEIERQEREAKEKRIRFENIKAELLIRVAKDWQTARLVKDLIEEVKRDSVSDLGHIHSETKLKAWIEWATSISSQLDPLSEDFLTNWNWYVNSEKSKHWDLRDIQDE